MIYLVHFERPYKHARHYLGFTDNLAERFKRHMSNAKIRRGSALMNAIVGAGIGFKVVWTRPGDRTEERRLKSGGHARRCPICQGKVSYESLQCKLNGGADVG